MRIPNECHLGLDLRIHEIVPDFTLEDVWELPEVVGTEADFELAVRLMLEADPANGSSGPARFLWRVRGLLGRWFGLGGVAEPADGAAMIAIPGTDEPTLSRRLPTDLRGTADGLTFDHLPFVPLFWTPTEYAAEISNATVHGVLHLAWVHRDDGTFQGRMAVYVKPRGWFGNAYMAVIKPFRYLVVYPAAERQIARQWAARRPAQHGAEPPGRSPE